MPAGSRRQSDVAYDLILQSLFERKLPAGAFVSQADLVELLGVPVAPLRDALRVLEADGILRIHPRSGIEFIKPGLGLTRSTYQFRTIIERAAVRLFAEVASDQLIEKIGTEHESLIERLTTQGFDPSSITLAERMEDLLHNNVIGILQNPLIESSYRQMYNLLRLVRLERSVSAPVLLRNLREHVAIIDACRRRDADGAERAIHEHLALALQRQMGLA